MRVCRNKNNKMSRDMRSVPDLKIKEAKNNNKQIDNKNVTCDQGPVYPEYFYTSMN